MLSDLLRLFNIFEKISNIPYILLHSLVLLQSLQKTETWR